MHAFRVLSSVLSEIEGIFVQFVGVGSEVLRIVVSWETESTTPSSTTRKRLICFKDNVVYKSFIILLSLVYIGRSGSKM